MTTWVGISGGVCPALMSVRTISSPGSRLESTA